MKKLSIVIRRPITVEKLTKIINNKIKPEKILLKYGPEMLFKIIDQLKSIAEENIRDSLMISCDINNNEFDINSMSEDELLIYQSAIQLLKNIAKQTPEIHNVGSYQWFYEGTKFNVKFGFRPDDNDWETLKNNTVAVRIIYYQLLNNINQIGNKQINTNNLESHKLLKI